MGIDIQPCPFIAIFATPAESGQLNLVQRGIINLTCLIAKQHLLLQWKSSNPPSVSQWLKDTVCFSSFLKL